MMLRRLRLVTLGVILVLATIGCAGSEQPTGGDLTIALVPRPVSVERLEGAFVIDGATTVRFSGADASLERSATFLATALRDATGHAVPLDAANGKPIELGTDGATEEMGEEGYRLEVSPDRIRLVGPPAGLFRGIQTIRQLLQGDRVPAVRIEDRPRFAWRGLHLDVGRHWFPVDEIKRYIDVLALFKMNTFHWHLTEDQGWRIEIKRYPKLTSVGAFREESPKPGARDEGDGVPYGGFYTQDEIREVVRYAAERFVTVVPEIEMPGHAQAAIAAYPELGNSGDSLAVRTRWGVSRHVYNVEESTFEFLENVLDEVMELFPGEFIHIGGDECPKDEWRASPRAQARMKAEGLADEHELQSWFIRRIERYLNGQGRRLIGWDEIREGGLAPNAAMMVWRDAGYGVEAVRHGHDIVMSPTSHCYFDYYQGQAEYEPEAIGGFLPLERVYAFEPIPGELEPDEARHVLGAQGNLWTEYMRTMDHVFYMAYPRGAALAEVLWTPVERRDFEDFRRRWSRASGLLDRQGVNHRLAPPRAMASAYVSAGASDVAFEAPPAGGSIRYTLDGSAPTASSKAYDGPIPVDESGSVIAALFTPSGRHSAPVVVDVVRASPEARDDLEPGLWLQGYRGVFDRVPAFDDLEAAWVDQVERVRFTGREPDEEFALRFSGYLAVDESAVFEFELGSDDGSVLRIAGARVVSLDGLHPYVTRRASVHLEKGVYRFELGYFERGGGQKLELSQDGPGRFLRRRELKSL